MSARSLVVRLGGDRAIAIGGALVALVVGVLLYTRYNLDQNLTRDEAIYSYAGQQLSHGHSPYASIFDPKGPVTAFLAAFGALIAHAFGANDVHGIRVVFFVVSCLTVVAMYLLARALFGSVAAGVVAAVVFASFIVFARDALGGPDAKTPGILAGVLCMWLLVRRQWYLAGFAAGCAFLTWQPLLVFPVAAVVVPPLQVAGRRMRAAAAGLGGVLTPIAAFTIYFAASRSLGDAFESTVVWPLTGDKKHWSLRYQVDRVHAVVVSAYGNAEALLLVVGIAALFVAAIAVLVRGRHQPMVALRNPLVCVVLLTMLFNVAFPFYDFQGGPDTLPLTPYSALGIAAVAAYALAAVGSTGARRAVTAVVAVFTVAVGAHAWVQFDRDRANDSSFKLQTAYGCQVDQVADGGRIWALGDPTILVVTHRRNPDRYIYLGTQIADWKVKHTKGGFAGWQAQIAHVGPPVIILQTWHTALAARMQAWLVSQGYSSGFVGPYHVLLTPAARQRAAQMGVDVRATQAGKRTQNAQARLIRCDSPGTGVVG